MKTKQTNHFHTRARRALVLDAADGVALHALGAAAAEIGGG
jgi:hypothetical protein